MLKWVVERLEGTAAAVETPVGHLPAPGSLDVAGLDLTSDQLARALRVDADEWRAELPLIEEWFATCGDELPSTMADELEILRTRLG